MRLLNHAAVRVARSPRTGTLILALIVSAFITRVATTIGWLPFVPIAAGLAIHAFASHGDRLTR